MERLRIISEETTNGINEVLVSPLTEEQHRQVADIVEKSVIKALLEGQHRAVDAC